MLDKDLTILECNYRTYEILGIPHRSVRGKSIYDILALDGIKPKALKAGIQDKMVEAKENENIRVNLTVRPVRDEYMAVIETFENVYGKINRLTGASAKFAFQDIIGNSRSIQGSLKLAKRAAGNTANVFINGESGTGKELFAQAIHNASNRSSGPFVAVNCSALPKGLIESELFGYEGGSFTGSRKEGSAGKFELANGGTIFLDELGDMPLDAQMALLRVLQNREITRIGSDKTIPIDVRVITATNRDLTQLIEEGMVREDLYYRINVFPIRIPPLRERKEDIMLLAKYFLNKYHSFNESVRVNNFSRDAADILQAYDWPGNVRQLENAIERAVAISDDSIIRVECLPREIVEAVSRMGRKPGSMEENYTDSVSQPTEEDTKSVTSLKEMEKNHIEEALRASGGNVKLAAEMMGISRRNLYRKMEHYAIEASKFRG